MSDEKSSFQPGEKIGDYEVVSVLGFGATGTVYLAQHAVLKKLFAVKVLNGELAFMPEFVRVFQHEAQIVAALNHENIVPVHNFGECGGFYYYVMDFVNGGTLEDVRRRNGGRLRPEAAIPLIISVARGLAYAHGYGVVHRDLKPENILLTRTGTPQITDFGMAHVDRKYIAGQRRLKSRQRLGAAAKFRSVVGVGGVPASGTVLASQTQIAIEENAGDKPEVEGGTEGYIAPEVARGNAATPRADVYALGVLLHFLLVGETPPEPGSLSPEIYRLRSRALTGVLKRSLEAVPTKRYPTAKEFLEALESVASAPARRRRKIFCLLAGVLVVAAFAAAFAIGERSQLRKTENRVVAATQKIFEKEPPPDAPSDEKIRSSRSDEYPAILPGQNIFRENPEPAEKTDDAASAGKDSAGTPPQSAAARPNAAVAEVAEREYWERFYAERTGRRAIGVSFFGEGNSAGRISTEKMLSFPQDIPAGTYNIYLRTDGDTPAASVPVRFSIGGDSVLRVVRFSGAPEDAALRFFSVIDVSLASDRIFIEIPPADGESFPEVGVAEVELRPTFSNADFSRMFSEFLSVFSAEK